MCNFMCTICNPCLSAKLQNNAYIHTGEALSQRFKAGGVEVRVGWLQVTYILVLHVFEQPQLSVGSLCVDDGLEGSGQLLHRYLQDCLHVIR